MAWILRMLERATINRREHLLAEANAQTLFSLIQTDKAVARQYFKEYCDSADKQD